MVILRVAPAAARAGSARSAAAPPAAEVNPRAPPTTSERRETFFRGHLTTLSSMRLAHLFATGHGVQKIEGCPRWGRAFRIDRHDFRRMTAIYVCHRRK